MPNDPTDVFKSIEMLGPDECWRWLGPWGGRPTDRRPYFMAAGKRTMAYRWVWELVNGVPVPDGQVLRHTCDRGAWPIGCCNPYHVVPGSHQDNMDDMTSRDRHGLPKTARDGIRRLLDQGRLQHEVADLYGVSRETVSAIATGRVYKRDAQDDQGEPPHEVSDLRDE